MATDTIDTPIPAATACLIASVLPISRVRRENGFVRLLRTAVLEIWGLFVDDGAPSGVAIVEGPVLRTGATSKIRSVYVRDPDFNLVEISEPVAG